MTDKPNIRAKMLRVRFSDDEWQHLQQKADEAGLSMSALVRDHIGKVQIRHREDERKRLAMLNRINANLNMIARWCNTHKGAMEAVDVVSALMSIDEAISKAVRGDAGRL